MKIEYQVLAKDIRDQKYLPLLWIPLSNVCPSTLHIFLGLIDDLLKKIEKCAKYIDFLNKESSIYEKIQEVLRKHRIDKKAWFMTLTGRLFLHLIIRFYRQSCSKAY